MCDHTRARGTNSVRSFLDPSRADKKFSCFVARVVPLVVLLRNYFGHKSSAKTLFTNTNNPISLLFVGYLCNCKRAFSTRDIILLQFSVSPKSMVTVCRISHYHAIISKFCHHLNLYTIYGIFCY